MSYLLSAAPAVADPVDRSDLAADVLVFHRLTRALREARREGWSATYRAIAAEYRRRVIGAATPLADAARALLAELEAEPAAGAGDNVVLFPGARR